MKSYLRRLVALGLLLGLAGQAKAQPTYAFTIFDVPGASFPAYAQGINTSGQIVGHYVDADGIQHGFLFDNGSYTTLDVPVGPRPGPSCCPYISATGINDSGQIVGGYGGPDGTYGFLLDHGSYTTVTPFISADSRAFGINATSHSSKDQRSDARPSQHSFYGGVILVTLGDQTLTATDMVCGITGSATITVGPGP